MTRPQRWLPFLLALLLTWPRLSLAGDGKIAWRTLHADGIELTFPRDYEPLARRILATWLDARKTLTAVLPPEPGTLQLTLDDFADTSNGFASVLPYDQVHLYAYPPGPDSELGDHGDWIRALVFHEYSHILHLGDIAGPPSWLNYVLGRTLMPNAGLPRFLTEGLATWAETRLTGGDVAVAGRGGRVESPAFLATLRANVLDDNLPELSELTGTMLRWPRGQGWYLYGSALIDDLAQEYGAASIRQFIDSIAPRMLGLGIQGTARYTWGKSLSRAWLDTRARLRAHVQADWRARGVDVAADVSAVQAQVARLEGRALTDDGEWRGRMRSWPDGQSVVVAHQAADATLLVIERLFADGHRTVLHTCRGDCDEPLLTPDARWLLYTETRPFERLYKFRDLIAVPLDGQGRVAGPELQVTHGARLRSTALSPDGSRLVAVRVALARTAIDVLPLSDALVSAQAGRPEPAWQRLVAPPPFGQTLDSPVLLADGRLLWTAFVGNHRRLQGQGAETLAPPGDWLGDVAVRPDGQLGAVLERGGFRDAAVLVAGQWQQRTQTLTGVASAAQLGPAGAVATVRHGSRGLDVYLQADEAPANVQTPSSVTPSDLPYAPTPAEDVAVARYNPLRTAWPRAWRPLLTATGDRDTLAPGGVWVGAQVAGEDALSHWNWLASGQIRDDGTDPIGSLTLNVTRWEPTWSLTTGYQQGISYLRRGFAWRTTPTDRWGVGARGSWTLPGVRSAWTFDSGWRLVKSSLRDDRYAVKFPYDPGGPAPVEPWTGIDSFVDAGVSYAYGSASPDAATTEDLHTVAARASVSDSWTGGARRRVILNLGTAQRWHLGRHWVAEVDGNLALIPVSGDTSPSFAVRGIQPVPTTLLAGSGTGAITVRGMPYDAITRAGDGMAWGTAQLHVPLLTIGRGFDTLPLWLGRLRATPFVDGAWAFLPPPKADSLTGGVWSTGAELLLNWRAGYGLDGTLRLGAGHAFVANNTAWWLVLGL